jgi:mannose/cellobiose epimerase-like protein (N-acyl-D-glucosamine 2-epimerase family)
VAHLRDRRDAYGMWRENLRERGHLKDLDIDGKTVYEMCLQEVGWSGMD